MSEPSEKSPDMAETLEKLFGRSSAIKSDTCCICKGAAQEFSDELSRKEYTISGMCQTCQDSVFGGE